MKAILVIENPDTYERIISHISPLGFNTIHYANPVKAIDNIEEISPDLVIFSAEDFPRHWKPYLSLLREIRGRDDSVFIILRGESFSEEEASKAAALEVNGIVGSLLESEEDISKLEEIFSRYGNYRDDRGDRRILGKYLSETEFIFSHPKSFALISGALTDLSLGGLSFNPDNPQDAADIPEGVQIDGCSLSIEGQIHNVSVKVVRNNRIIAFHYVELDPATKDALINYLDMTPARKLKMSS
jgi:hypothetical protein